MKMIFRLLSAAIFTAVFSSCNTTIGLGRDMRILGESMETQANKSRGSEAADTSGGAPVY